MVKGNKVTHKRELHNSEERLIQRLTVLETLNQCLITHLLPSLSHLE